MVGKTCADVDTGVSNDQKDCWKTSDKACEAAGTGDNKQCWRDRLAFIKSANPALNCDEAQAGNLDCMKTENRVCLEDETSTDDKQCYKDRVSLTESCKDKVIPDAVADCFKTRQ